MTPRAASRYGGLALSQVWTPSTETMPGWVPSRTPIAPVEVVLDRPVEPIADHEVHDPVVEKAVGDLSECPQTSPDAQHAVSAATVSPDRAAPIRVCVCVHGDIVPDASHTDGGSCQSRHGRGATDWRRHAPRMQANQRHHLHNDHPHDQSGAQHR